MTLPGVIKESPSGHFFTKRAYVPYKHGTALCGSLQGPMRVLNMCSLLLRDLGTGHREGITSSAPAITLKVMFREHAFQDPGKQGLQPGPILTHAGAHPGVTARVHHSSVIPPICESV